MESKDNYFFKGKKESVWPFVRKRVKKKIIKKKHIFIIFKNYFSNIKLKCLIPLVSMTKYLLKVLFIDKARNCKNNQKWHVEFRI